METSYKELADLVAEIYADKDWHKLSDRERRVVKILEEMGYLKRNNPANGFVGKVTLRVEQLKLAIA